VSCPWDLVSQGDEQGLRGTPCGWWKHGGSTDGITGLDTRPCAFAPAVMIEGVPRGRIAARPPPTRFPEALSAMSAGAVLDGRFRASGRGIGGGTAGRTQTAITVPG